MDWEDLEKMEMDDRSKYYVNRVQNSDEGVGDSVNMTVSQVRAPHAAMPPDLTLNPTHPDYGVPRDQIQTAEENMGEWRRALHEREPDGIYEYDGWG